MVFGELPIETVELSKFVIEQVRTKCAAHKSNAVWTRTIKGSLAELGKSLEFRLAGSGDRGEHLLDLIWQRQPPRCDIVLAVECEWGYNNQVLEDFEKLMHIKSPLKLMLSALYRDGGANNNIGRLVEQLRDEYLSPFSQHIRGETYLLVNFIGPKYAAANAACYQFVADQDGKIQTVSITPLVPASEPTIIAGTTDSRAESEIKTINEARELANVAKPSAPVTPTGSTSPGIRVGSVVEFNMYYSNTDYYKRRESPDRGWLIQPKGERLQVGKVVGRGKTYLKIVPISREWAKYLQDENGTKTPDGFLWAPVASFPGHILRPYVATR